MTDDQSTSELAERAGPSALWRVVVIAGGACFLILQAVFFFRLSGVTPLPPQRPDVLLVTIDTLRADHCSAYGYGRPTTPTLQRLADEGVRFETAYAPMATTAPAHASLFTSLYPAAHGVIRNGFVTDERLETLAEILRREGYVTGAFVSSFVLFHKFGVGQGFDTYDDDFTQSESTQPGTDQWEGVPVPGGRVDRRANHTVDRAVAWLDSPAVRGQGAAERPPAFLWVHLMDPHEPYVPPSQIGDPFGAESQPAGSVEQVVARYDAEIAFADGELDRLIRHFEAFAGGRAPLVVVTADHGEGLLDHGWRGHGPQIYEEAVRVPMVFHWKGVLNGPRTIPSPVSLLDLTPTLLSLAGVTVADARFDGRDLTAALRRTGGEEDANRPLFFQRRHYDKPGVVKPIPLRELDGLTLGEGVSIHGHKFGVRVGKWKYLEARDEPVPRELYDLAADPGERLNVAAEHPDQVERLSGLLAQWRRRQAQLFRLAEIQRVAEQDRAVLESLGYIDAEEEEPIDSEREHTGD